VTVRPARGGGLGSGLRRRLAGLALLLLLAPAACATDQPVVHWGAASVDPDEARKALEASVGQLSQTSYQMTLTNNGTTTGSGAADWPSRSARLKLTLDVDQTRNATEAVTIAGEFWVRLDYGRSTNKNLGITANAWNRIDPTKLRSVTVLPIDISGTNDDNPFDMHGWTRAVARVEHADATHFTGTVDLLKAGGVLGPTVAGKQALRPENSTVPFTATVDAQGRLTRFTVDASTVNPELSYDIAFTGYGAPVTIAKPAKAAEASAKLYAYYNAGS